MLAAFEPKDVVGDYGAAYRLLEATLFVAWSVGAAVYPVFSRLTTTSDPPVGLVFERSLKLSIALTLPLAAGALVLAGPLIELLYGSSYESAETALRLLTPAIALYPVCYLTGYLLVSQDRQRVLTVGLRARRARERPRQLRAHSLAVAERRRARHVDLAAPRRRGLRRLRANERSAGSGGAASPRARCWRRSLQPGRWRRCETSSHSRSSGRSSGLPRRARCSFERSCLPRGRARRARRAPRGGLSGRKSRLSRALQARGKPLGDHAT